MSKPLDWKIIRDDYESGQFSQSALERNHGVSRQAIKKRAARDQWVTPPLQVTVTPDKQGVINRDVNASVRVIEAIKYRQSGWTYDRIAQQCGYGNPASARNAIQRELERVIVQEIDEWRNDHTSRLEKIHEEVWPLAMDKSYKGRLFAVDRLLQIAEREAKMLNLDIKAEDAPMPQVVIEEVPYGYLEGPKVQP